MKGLGSAKNQANISSCEGDHFRWETLDVWETWTEASLLVDSCTECPKSHGASWKFHLCVGQDRGGVATTGPHCRVWGWGRGREEGVKRERPRHVPEWPSTSLGGAAGRSLCHRSWRTSVVCPRKAVGVALRCVVRDSDHWRRLSMCFKRAFKPGRCAKWCVPRATDHEGEMAPPDWRVRAGPRNRPTQKEREEHEATHVHQETSAHVA